MPMIVREVSARTILTKTGIPGVDWCLNPYIGCQHACVYCYATFMKKYSAHEEAWGEFVDAKINAPELLRRELRRRREGEVMLSSVTDCYQPLEARFKLTRACLELLALSTLEVSVLTKSDLVVRDLDIFKRKENPVWGSILALVGGSNVVWTPKDYRSLSIAGYQNCAAVFSCVTLIARSCGGIAWYVQTVGADGTENEIDNHPLKQLLNWPNEYESGSRFVEKVVSPQVIQKYDHFMEHRGTLITFILFLIPGFPKDALSYIIGLSHMKTTTFLIVCGIGRLLGTIMLSVSGNCARNNQNVAMIVILGLSILIVLLAYYYHDGLLNLLRRKRAAREEE